MPRASQEDHAAVRCAPNPQAGAAGVILLYHRVAASRPDPQLLCVAPRHFEEHLEVLKHLARPMSLAELVHRSGSASSDTPAVAVTFDDGYADNLLEAAPLLRRHGVPATVFVVGEAVGSRREFWWDELERVLLQPGALPRVLRGPWGGSDGLADLGQDAVYAPDAAQRHASWNVTAAVVPTERHRLYLQLCETLRPLPADQRVAVLEDLAGACRAERSGRRSHRPLTPEELARLVEDGLVEVGAHTLTHALLAGLPVDRQRAEIVEGKRLLESVLGREVTSFSYPYGGRRDYTTATVALVREAGFQRACANFPGTVRPDTDVWQLPRVLVRDWDGDELARRLQGVLGNVG